MTQKLGEGSCGKVYYNPNTDKVYKVSKSPSTYSYFLLEIFANKSLQDNPFIVPVERVIINPPNEGPKVLPTDLAGEYGGNQHDTGGIDKGQTKTGPNDATQNCTIPNADQYAPKSWIQIQFPKMVCNLRELKKRFCHRQLHNLHPFIKKIMFHLFSGYYFMYKKHIYHLDIKDDNILADIFYNQHAHEYCLSSTKFCDFGLAEYIPSKHFAKPEYYVQTRWWRSPELLEKKIYGDNLPFSHKVDMWSLGIVMLGLYFCKNEKDVLPRGIDYKDQYRKILELEKRLPEVLNSSELDDSTKDFLHRLLQVDPLKRMHICDVFAHPYFANDGYKLDTSIKTLDDLDDSYRKFTSGPLRIGSGASLLNMDQRFDKIFYITNNSQNAYLAYRCIFLFDVYQSKRGILGDSHIDSDILKCLIRISNKHDIKCSDLPHVKHICDTFDYDIYVPHFVDYVEKYAQDLNITQIDTLQFYYLAFVTQLNTSYYQFSPRVIVIHLLHIICKYTNLHSPQLEEDMKVCQQYSLLSMIHNSLRFLKNKKLPRNVPGNCFDIEKLQRTIEDCFVLLSRT